MNRNEAKELLPIIKAFSEGKIIQVKQTTGEWVSFSHKSCMSFDSKPKYYRIKPEPKYRSFANAEECWAEMQKHEPFGWVTDKEDGHLVLITEIDTNGNISLLCNGGWDFDGIKNNFTFADGTPFGILEEE